MDLTQAELATLQPQSPDLLSSAPIQRTDKARSETYVTRAIHLKQTLLYVKQADLYYYKDDDIYRRLDDDTLLVWVRTVWEKLFGDGWSAKELENAMKKVQAATKTRITQLDKRYIKIAPDLFWDAELCQFADSPAGNHVCFAALFDSPYEDTTTIRVPPLTSSQLEALRSTYERDLATLQAKHTLPEDYAFVTAWACGDHDVYMDMIKCHAFSFMPPSRDGSPILIGSGANGKSTYLDLLHSIWGRNNTTSFTMKQMADKHFQLSLAYSYMNAPDEEKEYTAKERDDVQYTFKILSARGRLPAEKMFSQSSAQLTGDFVSFFPMNHLPQWRGTGVKALVRRSLVVPFYADFQAQANGIGKRFFKDTFTPDVISRYLGTLFAVATYYVDRDDMFPSAVMKLQQDELIADTDNTVTYKREFELFFDSYQTFNTLWQDYLNWCAVNGVTPQSKDAFRWTFDPYIKRNRVKAAKKYSYFEHGKRYNPQIYRAQSKTNRLSLMDHYNYENFGPISRLHDENHRESIVWKMAENAQSVYGENWRAILAKQAEPKASTPPKPEQPPLVDDIFK